MPRLNKDDKGLFDSTFLDQEATEVKLSERVVLTIRQKGRNRETLLIKSVPYTSI